jgi:hypothetical protein
MKKLLFVYFFLTALNISAQNKKFYTVSSDSTKFSLTIEGAEHLAGLPLKCILQEYPNDPNHTSESDSDQLRTPHQIHPAFYGCLDWHSCVHGHWMLIRLLKQFPELEKAKEIRSIINKTSTPENILTESNYFNTPTSRSFERTYGWGWALKLQQELLSWDDADAKKWSTTLQPLTDTIIKLWTAFLPKQTYASRSGTHGNTAFGLVFALDYARATNNKDFEKEIVKAAKRLFYTDKNIPAIWEPNGSDFLSPSLEEADLMRRILSPKEFLTWFNKFYSDAAIKNIVKIPVVSDRTDYQIVHLDGLSFSRSWCMRGIANILPVTDKRKNIFLKAAINQLNTGLSNVVSGAYGGEHWLASFAVYALSNY